MQHKQKKWRASPGKEERSINPQVALTHCFGGGVKYSASRSTVSGSGWSVSKDNPDTWVATFDTDEADYIVSFLLKVANYLKEGRNDSLTLSVHSNLHPSREDTDRKTVFITTNDAIKLTDIVNRACEKATSGRCKTLAARYMAARSAEGKGGRSQP